MKLFSINCTARAVQLMLKDEQLINWTAHEIMSCFTSRFTQRALRLPNLRPTARKAGARVNHELGEQLMECAMSCVNSSCTARAVQAKDAQ